MAQLRARASSFSWPKPASLARALPRLIAGRRKLIPSFHCSMNSALRAAVITEWRGLPERKLQADRWQSPSELMPKLMQRLGLRERLRETEVIDAWSKIVGDFIAAHSTPVALREGILYVRVLQPALHYELEQISKSEILRKLKQRFGGKTIRDIRFRVG
jgi:predicted nucleic acid-binding Zn ribbon protein